MFCRAAITLGIGPHSSYLCSAASHQLTVPSHWLSYSGRQVFAVTSLYARLTAVIYRL